MNVIKRGHNNPTTGFYKIINTEEELLDYLSKFFNDFKCLNNKFKNFLVENKDQTYNESEMRNHFRHIMVPAKFKSQIDYWLNRGFNVDESKLKVSELQSMLSNRQTPESRKSVGKKISKFFKEMPEEDFKAMSCWNKEYWMKHKGLSEVEAIAKVSSYQKSNTLLSANSDGRKSRPESECVDYIESIFDIKFDRYKLIRQSSTYNKNILPDATYKNFIIEFNGDFWHANPDIYKRDRAFLGGQTAADIWEHERIRNDHLKSLGYNVFIIWENDWNKNKEDVINKLRIELANQGLIK